MAIVFIGASLIFLTAHSLANGFFWPIALSTVLVAIYSVGLISTLNWTVIKDENNQK